MSTEIGFTVTVLNEFQGTIQQRAIYLSASSLARDFPAWNPRSVGTVQTIRIMDSRELHIITPLPIRD